MTDIYNIIAKHFANESSSVEDRLVEQFKKENPIEFKMLSKLWQSKNIEVKHYDTQKAWRKLVLEKKKSITPQNKTVKIIPLRTRMMRYVAVAASLMLLAMVVYNSVDTATATMMMAENTNSKSTEIQLCDGSTIWLNKGAKVEYPKEFDSKNRLVTLSGEAFFDIAKNPNKPFIITTNHSTVTVLGTSFNINSASTQTTISVKTGKVKVASLDQQKSVMLIENESAIVNEKNIIASKSQNTNYLAWKTGVFKFTEQPISQVVTELNKYYNTKLIIKNTTVNCPFTATFHNDKIADIAKIISLSCSYKLKKVDNHFELY